MRRNGRDAPITAVRAIGPVGFDPNRSLIRPAASDTQSAVLPPRANSANDGIRMATARVSDAVDIRHDECRGVRCPRREGR